MQIKPVKSFYYRIGENMDDKKLYSHFNTDKNGVLRNNPKINFYSGEWVKIQQNDYITHLVKPTETLYSIATKHNVGVNQLIKDNNLLNEKLFIGQKIKIFKDDLKA